MSGLVRPYLWGAVSGSLVTAAAIHRGIPALRERLRAAPDRVQVSRPSLIVNRWSGGGKADRCGLVERARALGASVTVLERGDDLATLARDAVRAGADALGMAGGDGSLGLVAQVAMEHDLPFFCIPVGTRNHFALDLGLKRDDPLWSLRALTDGDALSIDVGLLTLADGTTRAFLNNVSFGIYAQAVERPEYRDNKARTLARVVADATADPRSAPSVHFRTPDGTAYDRAAVLLVSNNRYVWSGPPDFGRREALDGGTLGILAVSALPEGVDPSTVTLGQVRGRAEWTATELAVGADGDPVAAGVDGEAVTLASPVRLSTVPSGLRVLVPSGTRPGYLPPTRALEATLLDIATLATQADNAAVA